MIDPTDFIPHDNPKPTLAELNNIFYKASMDNDITLKSFILYTQALEALYHEWKDYWIKVLTK